jgi:hypothetical protein
MVEEERSLAIVELPLLASCRSRQCPNGIALGQSLGQLAGAEGQAAKGLGVELVGQGAEASGGGWREGSFARSRIDEAAHD